MQMGKFAFICAEFERVHICVQQFSPPGGLITVSGQITGEHFLSAIRIWLYFSLSGTCESLCVISVFSLWSSSTHSGDEVEGRSAEPAAVSQSLFTGCIQRGKPTVCCYCAHVHYNVFARVCVFLCINATRCLARWVPSRPGKERLLEEIGMLVRPLKLTNQFRGMMPTLSESESLMPVTPPPPPIVININLMPAPPIQAKKEMLQWVLCQLIFTGAWCKMTFFFPQVQSYSDKLVLLISKLGPSSYCRIITLIA